MFSKIKFYLSKITVGRKSYLFLLSLFIFFSLFLVAKPARADFLGIADSFWGLLDSQLGALDFVDSVVLELLVYLILGLAMSQAFLIFSAKLFQWAIDFPINLGVTTENPLVTSGWQFTSGLVNTLFILIFIAIALAYILRMETFGAKKALPRLIIVAILLNFSLVFVGIGVDISQLTLKAITSALGSDLPSLAIIPITNSFQNLVSGYLGIVGAYVIGALIPYVNVAGAVALIATIISPAFLGTLSTTILLIILGIGLGGVFLLYSFLFIIRVGMIWMLAILSPLAFASSILPSTRKHWEEWWKLLLDWLFFGIIVVLLAGLGLKLFAESTVVPAAGPIAVGPHGLFPAFTYNYLFLLIYMGLMIYYSKTKFAPELAGALIGQAQGLVKRATPMGQAAKRGFEGWLVKQEEEEKKIKEKVEGKKSFTMRERAGATLFKATKLVSRPARLGYRYLARTTPERRMAQEIEREESEITKSFGKDYVSAASTYHRGLNRTRKIALGLYLQKAKGAKGLEKLNEKQLKETIRLTSEYLPPRLEDIVKHKSELIDDSEVGGLIQRVLVSDGLEDSDVKNLLDIGIKEAGAIRKAAFKKAVDALGTGDVDNLALDTLKSEDFQEMVVRFKNVSFIRKIGEEKGQEYIDLIHKKFEELGAKEVAGTNAILLRQSVTNPGFRAVFPAPKEIRDLPKITEVVTDEDGKEKEVSRPATDRDRMKKITELTDAAKEETKKRREAREAATLSPEKIEPSKPSVGGRGPRRTGRLGGRRSIGRTGRLGGRRDRRKRGSLGGRRAP